MSPMYSEDRTCEIPITGHGNALQFSPEGQLAVATSSEFGSFGPGALCILESPNCWRSFDWPEGLLDLCWSRNGSHDLVLTASLDGSMQLWHARGAESENTACQPDYLYKEHVAEVYSVDWTTINQNPQILSGSWDSTCKLWDPNRPHSLLTFSDPDNLIYSVNFSGGHRSLFCSSGSDGTLKIWSLGDSKPLKKLKVGLESPCSAWNGDNCVAVGNDSGVISVFDVRMDRVLKQLKSGNSAVRKIRYSPFDSNLIASVGFDAVTRIWNVDLEEEVYAESHHEDVVLGVDWNPKIANCLADCGWSSQIRVFFAQSPS